MHNPRLPLLLTAILATAGLSAPPARAAAPASPQGLISARAYLGIAGTAVANLTNHVKFPGQPDVLQFPSYFEWAATGDYFTPPGNWGDNYGTRISGYFHPPSTGDYVFWIASDDNSSLYLSTDEDPLNRKLIARESNYSSPRQYFDSGNSDATMKDSSQFTGTEWPTLDPGLGGARITLQAGKAYYIEALGKEGGGGDNLSVSVLDPSATIDPNFPIPGDYLSSDRANGPLVLVTPPESQQVDERGAVTFRVVADGTPPYTFQWRKNGVDIPDATEVAYSIASVAAADHNAKYSVVVSGAQGSATSAEAVLTVTADTQPPVLIGARGSASLAEVTLTFSEVVTGASANTASNYKITSAKGDLAVTGAELAPGGTVVTLTTAAQSLGTKYTVTAANIQDTAATPNTIAASSKAVFFPKGKLVEKDGFIVFEAENYDRNLDGIWVPDTTRGTPSGGVSMVSPNGAGGSETATRLEYDVEFKQAATYVVWFRASGDNGNDDSAWFHLDGERPPERAAGNAASMTGFQPQSDFVWRSDAQDPPDPFTVDIYTPGPHVVGLARREDGAFFDKFILTTDLTYTPTLAGPPETREGVPSAPTVALTAPTAGQKFAPGSPIVLSASATGDLGLEIAKVEFTANDSPVGTATASPFQFSWTDAPDGIYSIRAVATDEIGGLSTSDSVVIEVGAPSPTSSARIAWVSFHPADDSPSAAAAAAGFTRAPDAGYTDLLTANGHQVTRIVTSGSPDASLLNAFDLVILSRSVPSGDYQDPPETAAWNGLTAPTLVLGGYVLRSTRLGFTIGGAMLDTVGPVKLNVRTPNHPIFAGISLDASGTMANPFADVVTFNDTLQRGISVNMDPVAGDGTVLAVIATPEDPTVDGMVIGEWQKGAVLGNAAPDTLAGHRLVFLTGSREQVITAEGAGIYDLNPDGEKLFLNAVNYLAGTTPAPPAPTLSLTRSANGVSITFTGALQSADAVAGPWTDVPGATSPLVVSPSEVQRFYRAKR